MKISTLLLLIIAGLSSTPAYAQKGESNAGLFENKDDYHQFMVSIKDAANGDPELKAMVPLINDIAQGREIGSTGKQYGETTSTLGLLASRAVREDIEMVDEQYQELKNRNAEIQRRLGEQLRAIDFSDSENVVGQIRNIRDQAEEELNAVLLPHQVQRLRQIRMQALLRGRNLFEILTSDPFKTDLEITDEQSGKLREAQAEIQAEMEQEIAKLRQQAQDRLLSKLDRSQQAQVEELIGDAFEFKDQSKKISGKENNLGEKNSEKKKKPSNEKAKQK